MGICKFVDALLFIYFLIITFAVVFFDSQVLFPSYLYPYFLVEPKEYYTRKCGHHLILEKPYFFQGIAVLQLLVNLPLSIANIHGIVAKKSWYGITCLIQGVCSSTCLVPILSELVFTRKASKELLIAYIPFVGFSLLAFVRGLVSLSKKNTSSNVTKGSARKKKA